MNTRIFVDTNIMLDLLGERVPYYDSIAKIATLADKGSVTLIVSALSYATVYYLLSKYESNEATKEKLRKFKVISEISALDEMTIEKGLNSDFSDFEDSLQYYSAIKSESNIILSRNQKDFSRSEIPVMSADEYLVSIRNK
jgi:predicted nucleic acid-binding protein